MANAYFLNVQNLPIALELNSGSKFELAALNSESDNPYADFPLKAIQDKNVLGTNSINQLSVTSKAQADPIRWQIEMTHIAPNADIQFLVFENQLAARQGSTVEGFIITPLT